jgi:hypothetical protein
MEEKPSSRRIWLLLAALLLGMVLLGGTYTALAGPPLSSQPGEQLAASPSAVAWSSGWVALAPGEIRSTISARRIISDPWSSGWAALAPGETRTITHNRGLDPEQYAVELWFLDTDPGGWGINRRYYGGVDFNGQHLGADWRRLTSNTIQVMRNISDTAADKVRVLVWVPELVTQTYDSGWVNIAQGENKIFTHSLGVAADDLTVSLSFSTTAGTPPFGINQIAYGSKTFGAAILGANWHHLTNSSVQVVRRSDDVLAQQVRVTVNVADPPKYDSAWQTVQPGEALTLTHGLDWPPEMLVAVGECKNDPNPGIHQMFAGGNHSSIPAFFPGWQGSDLQNVTSDTITIFRWDNDTVCPQVRVRLWERSFTQDIPVIMRE